jgi:hypothetical protein
VWGFRFRVPPSIATAASSPATAEATEATDDSPLLRKSPGFFEYFACKRFSPLDTHTLADLDNIGKAMIAKFEKFTQREVVGGTTYKRQNYFNQVIPKDRYFVSAGLSWSLRCSWPSRMSTSYGYA